MTARDDHRHGMNRRDLMRLAALGGAAAALGTGGAGAAPRGPRDLVRPKHLAAGDTIGLVLPASLEFEAHRVDLAQRQLEALGFRVTAGEHVKKRHGYLAGSDRERAEDLNRMFADPEIDGIVCHRGGWGTPRLLPHLDYDAIRKNPKVLIGFSDVTALINAVHKETGLVTFHGPNGASGLEPYTLEHFRRVVMSTEPIGTLEVPPKGENELVNRSFPILTIRGGTATAPLIGGNLTLIASLMGTPWEVGTDGKILFLEDIDEDLYRIDRMLTQLALGGKLEKLAGFVFGFCTDCDAGQGPSFSLEEILRQHFEPLGIPAVSGLAIGHIQKKITLPLGLEATLDADAGTISFDEAAVV